MHGFLLGSFYEISFYCMCTMFLFNSAKVVFISTENINVNVYTKSLKVEYFKCIRGRPELSSFTSMIIPTIRGGRGLENDGNYHNFYSIRNMF